MVLIINIITLGILSIILTFLITVYLKNTFNSISIIYKFTILLAPLVLTTVNLIYLYRIQSSKILLALLPLLVPFLYGIFIKFQNFIGHKTHKKFKEFSTELVTLGKQFNLNITSDDIRIRVKKRNNVSIIFNVYTTNDEKTIKLKIDEFHQLINSTFKNYNVEILIDKKKGEHPNFHSIQYT